MRKADFAAIEAIRKLAQNSSLGVTMRGIPTMIRETFDWLKSEPFR